MTTAMHTGRLLLRYSMAVVLVVTVALLLIAAQIRSFVPERKPARLRDLIGVSHPGH